MKLNRLLEITTILLNKKTVTAAELAERFGVSVRTIYRDIDDLSSSGVPVYTTQGSHGGISLMEDYTVSRAALSGSERDSVLFALQALKATKYPQIDAVLEKLGSLFKISATDWVSVDFTPWGSNPDAHDRFSIIKAAILQSRAIRIEYINAVNIRSEREIEPLKLVYKGQAWYVYGYCLYRKDYRLFRLSRIRHVIATEREFNRETARIIAHGDDSPAPKPENPFTRLVLQFTGDTLNRLYDDYDDELLMFADDGSITLTIDFPEDEWIYSYILSFGSSVRVIKPEHIRRGVAERLRKSLEQYVEI